MKRELKKKVYVIAVGNMVAVCAKAVLSEKQFEKAHNNRDHINHMLDGVNIQLWFIDNDQPPYNLGIRSLVTGNTTSEAIAQEEERIKDTLDQLLEQIDKLPENKPAEEDELKEAEETQDAPADDHEEFLKALAKDIEDSLKQHFGKDVKYAFFVRSGNSICVDSTIHPLDIIHMMAYAAENQ